MLFRSRGVKSDLKDFERTFSVLKDFYYLHPEEIIEEIADGVVLNPKKEKRRWQQEEWRGRDKFANKHMRSRVMNKHR